MESSGRLKYLFNPRTKRGLFRKSANAMAQQLFVPRWTRCLTRQFFDFIASTLLAERSIVRVREEGVAEPTLDGPLEALHRILGQLADKLEDGRERDELLEQKQRIKGIRAGVTEWLTLGDKGHVYWGERVRTKRQTIVTSGATPIDVALVLRRDLFGCGTSVVCTSATLAMGGCDDCAVRRPHRGGRRAVGHREVAVRFCAQHAGLCRGGRAPCPRHRRRKTRDRWP